jgi:hypothetical protein
MTDLSEARAEFQRCQDAEKDNRVTALDDIRFALLEEQWPEDVLRARQMAQRPSLTINKLPAFMRQVVNDARQNKPAVEVHPADSAADPVTASIYAGTIRNIESVSNADAAYDTGSSQAVAGGFGYWRIVVDYAYDDAFDLDILIKRISNQFSVYGDPNSTEVDSSDWDVCFVTDRIPKKTYEKKYKGKATVDWDSGEWSTLGSDWLADDTVLIAEWWRRTEIEREVAKLDDGRIYAVSELRENEDLARALQGGAINIVGTRTIRSKKVTQTLISGADVLEEEKEFPCCYIPVVPVYGDEIIVEGKRYFRGLVHSAKDAQRSFNYWRSTATELVALAPRVPFIGPKGAFSIDDGLNTVNTENHAYLEYDGPQAPMRQPLDTGAAAGALQEALNASDDMKAIIGLYDASLGARSNETSGKAIMARQREGDVSTYHFVDNLTRAIRHTGRILVDMIPRVYTGERILRIMGEDGKPQNVKVNAEYPATDEAGQPVQEEVTDGMGNKVLQAVMAMHDLSVGKYDVVVKSGPSFTSRREEAAMQMTEMMRSFPAAAPIIGPELAKNLDWPGADAIADKLEKMAGGGEPAIPPELQQQIEQGQQLIQQLQAENEQLKAEKVNQQAQTAIDAQKIDVDRQKVLVERQKAATAQYEAQTSRFQAIASSHPAARIDALSAINAPPAQQ